MKTQVGTPIAILDRIIVQVDEAKETTDSGIYLPSDAQERPLTGKAVLVGPGRSDTTALNPSMSVKEGDRVYFGKYVGTKIELDGTEYTVLREEDVLLIVR